LEFYLQYRQFNKYLEKEVPDHLKTIVTEEAFLGAQSYGYDKCIFGFVKMAFDFFFEFVIVLWFFALDLGYFC